MMSSSHSGGKEQNEDNPGNDKQNKIIHPERSDLNSFTPALSPDVGFIDSSARLPLSKCDKAEDTGSNFDLLRSEEEDKLLDSHPMSFPSQIVHSTQQSGVGGKSQTAPSLRSISLPKGPTSHGTTSPQLGRATSETSVNGVPCSILHPPADKKAKKVVSEYYKKQNELLENFKQDNEQILVFQKNRTRQRLASTASQEANDCEANSMIPSNTEGDVQSNATRRKSTADTDKKDCDIEAIAEDAELLEKHAELARADKKASGAASRLATVTLIVNVSLMVAKAVASHMSGSLSIFSSLVDSIVDITSGALIYLSSRAIRKRDPYAYPRGKTRLEPLTLICISVIMAFASFQLLITSATRIANKDLNVHMNVASASIMIATIFVKATLALICKKHDSDASIRVLAQDHRNDCVSNIAALICAAFTPLPETHLTFFGLPGWEYLDPIGALLVSLYIIFTWYNTGKEHAVMLAGKSASPDFINRIIKVCIDHDPRIEHIDTVYVYHYGMKFLVEVHIVLDENMPLKVAHDISESLQINIESLPEVERAFVHTDYEYDHQPEDEHKVV